MSNKIIDLTEYKDNQENIETLVEDIPEDILNDYLKQVENDTPDLWSRIDEGFDREINLIDSENKARRRKTVGFIAAAALIVVIAIPIAILNVTNHKKSKDNQTTKVSSEDYIRMEESYADEKADSDVAEENTYSYDADVDMEAVESANEEEYFENNDYKDDTNSNDAVAGEPFDGNQSIGETDKQDNTDEMTDAAEVPENLIAKEVIFREYAYIYSGKVVKEKIPVEYNIGEHISNEYCDYPEDELEVLWTGSEEDTKYIFIRYGDTYVRYQIIDMN